MPDKVIMPQLGESIAEGTIVKWLKKPGDDVKKDEDLLVISTDKVEAEIPAPATGTLISIDIGEGQTVAVGTVLGYVGAKGEAAPAGTGGGAAAKPAEAQKPAAAPAPAQAAAPARAPEPAPQAAHAEEDRFAPSSAAGRFVSPLVRRIAMESGVSDAELDRLPGTGQNGRVTKKDLLQYVEDKRAGRAGATAGNGAAARPQGTSQVATQSGYGQQHAPQPAAARGPDRPSVVIPPGERELVKPASSMRRVIMQNMVASKQTSAHVHTFFEIDYTRIDKVRREHKDRFKAEEGVNLTYTTFLAAAVCQVLKRHPYINAEIRGTDILFKKDIHLGIAVAIEEPEPGLMVPVIRNADQMNLRGIAHSVTDLAKRARTRKIKPDELSGGTFTITNPGNYGAIIGTPVINQPQVAILGVGRISKQPVVVEVDGADAIAIRTMGWLSLGFDHRLIDGATADQFMADLKQTLESWDSVP